MMHNIRNFLRLAAVVKRIAESQADWETKYDLIFSYDVSKAIAQTGIKIEYCDPDTSYEDDVRGYAQAVERKAQAIRLALEPCTDDGEPILIHRTEQLHACPADE